MIRLSERLRAAADFVPETESAADIGTDHAYLPIYLVQSGRVRRAVASDVREGPLARARAHIEAAGLSERIRLVRSDGLADLPPDAGETLIITGMGGMLMTRILRAGDLSGFTTFVLAPQSDLTHVRTQLMRLGLRIEAENLICEDAKYYPILRAVHGADPDADPVRLRYGKHLLSSACGTLAEYLEREHASLTAAMDQIRGEAPHEGAAQERYAQLHAQRGLNEAAQERIRQEMR